MQDSDEAHRLLISEVHKPQTLDSVIEEDQRFGETLASLDLYGSVTDADVTQISERKNDLLRSRSLSHSNPRDIERTPMTSPMRHSFEHQQTSTTAPGGLNTSSDQ